MTLTDPTLREEIRRLERPRSRSLGALAAVRLAEAYRRAGEPVLALELLDGAPGSEPDDPAAHLVRGCVQLDLDRDDGASSSFLRVLELDPGNLLALRSMARLARQRGDLEEERDWIRRIHRADTADSESAGGGQGGPSDRGRSRPASHSPAEREELLRELAGVADPAWWSDDARTGADRGRREEDPQGSTAGGVLTETMARLYAEQGLWEKAEAVYEELADRRPDDAGLRARLERVRRREVPERRGGAADTAPGPDSSPPPESMPSPESSPSGSAPTHDGSTGRDVREHLRELLAGRADPDARPGSPARGPDAGGGRS